MTNETPLLEIRNATKSYGGGAFGSRGNVTALQDLSLILPESPARIVTIAGESGCGKTTLANAVLGFLPLTSGQVLYRGQDISTMNRAQTLDYRWTVQAVFQDPYAVYNPFYRVRHIFDLVIGHFGLTKDRTRAAEMIEQALVTVGLRGSEVLDKHPHQLSGGQRQRLMMARAYMLRPRIIVADEPVSMVDASLRAMILDIMLRLRDEENISFIYITHDLSTAYQIGDEIFMIYRGAVVETGNTATVIEQPAHPYVQLLLGSIPDPDPDEKWSVQVRTHGEDTVEAQGAGCRFYPRCAQRMDRCLTDAPPLLQMEDSRHGTACHLWGGSR